MFTALPITASDGGFIQWMLISEQTKLRVWSWFLVSLQSGFLLRIPGVPDVMVGIPLFLNNHDHTGGQEDRTNSQEAFSRNPHSAPVAQLLYKPGCSTHCFGWQLLLPSVPFSKGFWFLAAFWLKELSLEQPLHLITSCPQIERTLNGA